MTDEKPVVISAQLFGVSGYMRARLRRAKSGTVLYDSGPGKNMLMNNYLDALGTNTITGGGLGLGTPGTSYLACGTGSTAPSPTQTALAAEIAPASTNRSNTSGADVTGYVAGPPDYWFFRRVVEFGPTQANGPIAEIGWFNASTAGTMWARCLPKDAGGNPTTIPKTASTILDVTWEPRMQPIQGDIIIARTIAGLPYTITLRAIGCNTAQAPGNTVLQRGWAWPTGLPVNALGAREAAALLARTASSGLGSAGWQAQSYSTYVPGSYTRDVTFKSVNATPAMQFMTNSGGTNTDAFCVMQVGFSPNLPATTNITFRVSWAPI